MFHVSTCLLSKTFTSSSRRRRTTSWRRRDYDVVTTSSWRRRTRCRDGVVRRRDDDVRRRRTYITGFSVTFLCKYLSVLLTRCWYTVNEFIYDVSRIYLLTCLLAYKPFRTLYTSCNVISQKNNKPFTTQYFLLTYLLKSNPGTRFQNRFLRQITSCSLLGLLYELTSSRRSFNEASSRPLIKPINQS